MPRLDPRGRINNVERALLIAFALLVVAFSVLTVIRSAYDSDGKRKTDAGVYFRAGWAIRAGVDPYKVEDDNNWTFLYPPPVAIAMSPLADPPKGEPRAWMLPYPVSVTLWLVLSWVCLFVASHWIAKAIEITAPKLEDRSWAVGCRRWVQNRMHPVLLCLIGAGATINRGQINLILLFLLAGMILNIARGKRFTAGLWLAAAACLKVIPGFLLLVPLFRRDMRQLSGFAVGCFALMVVVPVITVGPTRAYDLNYRFFDTMVAAQLAKGDDQAKQKELAGAIDNQSVMAMMYNARNLEKIKTVAEINPDKTDKMVHWGTGAMLTLVTLLATYLADRRGAEKRRATIMLVGLLMCVMLAVSPVTHMNYFILCLPLVSVLWISARERGGPTPLEWSAAGAYFVAHIIPHVQPPFRVLMFLGMAMWVTLILWGVGIRAMLRRTKAPDAA